MDSSITLDLPEFFVPILRDLGFGGIFVVFIWQLWKKLLDKDKAIRGLVTAYREIIDKKDENMLRLVKDVNHSYNKNTEMQVKMKGVIEANTKAIDTLSEKVYDVLVSRERGGK